MGQKEKPDEQQLFKSCLPIFLYQQSQSSTHLVKAIAQ